MIGSKTDGLVSRLSYKKAPEGDEYVEFLSRTRGTFQSRSEGEKLFITDVYGMDLWVAFITNIPFDNRQHYNCKACKDFIIKFGGLVTISPRGAIISTMWNRFSSPPFFHAAVSAMEKMVCSANITSEFFSKDKVWGTPVTGEWRHLHVTPGKDHVYSSRTLSANQRMAISREDFNMLDRAVSEFDLKDVEQAVTLLKNDILFRSEKVAAIAEWFLQVKNQIRWKGREQDNLLWSFAANAPVGFCHIKSSMIGSLLADIADGYSLEEVKARFNKKMNPSQYQRPQALPARGNLIAAEKLVAKLGVEQSLERRQATLEDIKVIWQAPTDTKLPLDIFADVPTKSKRGLVIEDPTVVNITLSKFLRTVLPVLKNLEVYLPRRTPLPLGGYVTAMYPYAPPILQWDFHEDRNPVSHYLYLNGSTPGQWNLSPGWNKVTALSFQSHMWNPERIFSNHGNGIMFAIDGANDLRNPGNGLFPEILKSELREIRSAIEAFSARKNIHKVSDPICGLLLQERSEWNFQVRAEMDGVVRIFNLDRWD